MADLQECHSDVGLGLNLPNHSDLSVLGMAEQEIFAVVSVQHPLAAVGEVSISEIAKHQIVLPPQGSGLRAKMRFWRRLLRAIHMRLSLAHVAAEGLSPLVFRFTSRAKMRLHRQYSLRSQMKPANVRLVKLHGRTLSPAASKLAKHLLTLTPQNAR
ncbi:LysR substrate-binding domain-containing protein [Celeribacter halophilus]|nr:LysR substrate-binding domain-containing protein [Celeribacter halophilus]